MSTIPDELATKRGALWALFAGGLLAVAAFVGIVVLLVLSGRG